MGIHLPRHLPPVSGWLLLGSSILDAVGHGEHSEIHLWNSSPSSGTYRYTKDSTSEMTKETQDMFKCEPNAEIGFAN